MSSIHSTAILSDEVVVAEGSTIGAFTVAEGSIAIGERTWIGSHVVLGCPPEHRRFHAPGAVPRHLGVAIGDESIVHEFVAIQGGTFQSTSIGKRCMIMARVNIGHDCVVGEEVTIAPGAILGGEIAVGHRANIGIGALVHQSRRIGPYAMVGMGAAVVRDVPPFATVLGGVGRVVGCNRVGAERAGLGGEWLDNYPDILAGDGLDELPDEVRQIFQNWTSGAT